MGTGPPLRPRAAAALALGAALVVACGDGSQGEHGALEQAATRAEPTTLAEVVRTLSRSHQELRAEVGPHRLTYTFAVRMAPDTPPPDPAPAGPGHAREQAVTDQVELAWKPGALAFDHHNDSGRGRGLRIVGERLYTRVPHLPWDERDPKTGGDERTPGEEGSTVIEWHVQDLETDAHELWLDEAARGAAEALEFVAPALALGEPTRDGDLRTNTLTLREEPSAAAPSDGPGAWRGAVVFTKIDGELVLHGPSGTLRSLELVAEFTRPARGEEPAMSGSVRFSGRLAPAEAAQIQVEAPAEASPVPERRRLEPARRAVLRGLAAPGAGG